MSISNLHHRWYVYELIDPRDGLAFYVGKGQRDRIAAHEREAEKAEGVCSEKINRIKDIWAHGLQVERLHVAFFWDEQAAYDYEAERVTEYGLDALTNIMPGGGSCRGSYIRQKPEQPPKPWGPMEAVASLTAKDNLLSWFCQWLKAKAQGGTFEIRGDKWSVMFGEAAFNMFPGLWEKITSSREAIEALEPHVSRFGVRFDYGRA